MIATHAHIPLHAERKQIKQSPLAKIGMTLIGALVLGVCAWAISRVESHEGSLIRYGLQIEQLTEQIRDTKHEMRTGMDEIKQEIRRTR